MKNYIIWIYDVESDRNRPLICKAINEAEARRIGKEHISWCGLIGGEITGIWEVKRW